MYGVAEKLFYTFSAVILGSAFFVMQPNANLEVNNFQTQVQNQFTLATKQVVGDKPMFEDVTLVISSVNKFYEQSADAMIGMLTPPTSEDDVTKVATSMYKELAVFLQPRSLVNQPQVLGIETPEEIVPDNFMQEEAVTNIVPTNYKANIVTPAQPVEPTPSISLLNFQSDESAAVNDNQTWVNLRDNSTGQVYCVAIFNTEVNRYLGPCANDYH